MGDPGDLASWDLIEHSAIYQAGAPHRCDSRHITNFMYEHDRVELEDRRPRYRIHDRIEGAKPTGVNKGLSWRPCVHRRAHAARTGSDRDAVPGF